ncbi:MAG: glutaredoxin family protein [Gammaproteobacteria bacterium]|nr:glutaredoxin family protein [Gammaproteobacteria bacterium]
MQHLFVLYTTSGCHLCEQAESLIQQQTKMTVRPIEIAADSKLVERYGTRIPVLQHMETGAELGWPFDIDALQCWLDSVNRSAIGYSLEDNHTAVSKIK